MNLAQTWVELHYRSSDNMEQARAKALEELNKALGTNHTRGDLWRWEAGAGMRPDRREFMVRQVVPFINEDKRLKLSQSQVDELIEAVL